MILPFVIKVKLTINNTMKKFTLLLVAIIFISCSDNQTAPEPELEAFLCCGENPFLSENINNLDQSLGEISIIPVFTPNNDGVNDIFRIENIELYSYNSVTLYDLNNNIVYSTENYDSESNHLGGTNTDLETGTYKYKIVIKNEQTFVEYGYVCLVKGTNNIPDFSFKTECSINDPVLN